MVLNKLTLIDFDHLKSRICDHQVKQPLTIQSPPCNVHPSQLEEHAVLLKATKKYSILIDCSQIYINIYDNHWKWFETCLREQYPTVTGITFRIVNNDKKCIEISFGTGLECENALNKQFALGDKIVHVNKSLPESAQVVHIALSQIPHDSTADIREHLLQVLSEYGDILHLGLYVSKNGAWFTGRGYATLNVDKLKSFYKILCKNTTTTSIKYEESVWIRLDYRFST